MIRFACRCKHLLQAPDDQAGLTVQCPACGLLVDIPAAGDLGSIESDGTYRLDQPPASVPDENVELLKLIYYPGHKLSDGSEIDLRGPVEPLPLDETLADQPKPVERPKYDPATGELIQPLSVEQSPEVAPLAAKPDQIPEAKRVIDYNVSPDALEGSPHGLGVFAALFLPINLLSICIILGLHVILTPMITMAWYLPLLIPFPLAVVLLIAGHYAVALEEIGPAEKDDVPRILRNVQLWDDYVAPALRIGVVLLICYWPVLLVLGLNYSAAVQHQALPFPAAGRWLISLFVVGSVLLPAVLLTVCTSGTLLNLRPDRVVNLMARIGWRYALLVVEWLVASLLYLAGVVLLLAGFNLGTAYSIFFAPFVSFPTLILGIYLTFAFCWHLGLNYRMHWREYPWMAQYHEYKSVTISRPKLHPKLSAADENAAKRARARRPIR